SQVKADIVAVGRLSSGAKTRLTAAITRSCWWAAPPPVAVRGEGREDAEAKARPAGPCDGPAAPCGGSQLPRGGSSAAPSPRCKATDNRSCASPCSYPGVTCLSRLTSYIDIIVRLS